MKPNSKTLINDNFEEVENKPGAIIFSPQYYILSTLILLLPYL